MYVRCIFQIVYQTTVQKIVFCFNRSSYKGDKNLFFTLYFNFVLELNVWDLLKGPHGGG